MKTIGDPDTLATLTARVSRLGDDTPRRWGTLTPAQMLCHLADASASVLGERKVTDSKSATKPSRLMRWIALSTPLPWPKGLPTAPGANPLKQGSTPSDFETDRTRVIDGLNRLATAKSLAPHHPAFGPMSLRDWHRWAYRHVDHHLKQFGL